MIITFIVPDHEISIRHTFLHENFPIFINRAEIS